MKEEVHTTGPGRVKGGGMGEADAGGDVATAKRGQAVAQTQTQRGAALATVTVTATRGPGGVEDRSRAAQADSRQTYGAGHVRDSRGWYGRG